MKFTADAIIPVLYRRKSPAPQRYEAEQFLFKFFGTLHPIPDCNFSTPSVVHLSPPVNRLFSPQSPSNLDA